LRENVGLPSGKSQTGKREKSTIVISDDNQNWKTTDARRTSRTSKKTLNYVQKRRKFENGLEAAARLIRL